MNFNDKYANYLRKCNRLDSLKRNKVQEFSNTIKEDIKDLLSKSQINRSEVEDYLKNLRDVLKEKEAEMDQYVEEQKKALKNELLESISKELEEEKQTTSDYSLTNDVMEESIKFVEDQISSKNVKPATADPIAERLLKVMPQNTYVLEEDVTENDLDTKTDQLINDFENNEPVISPFDTTEEINLEPEPTTVTESEEEVKTDQISTVELEQMLAEFEDLLDE